MIGQMTKSERDKAVEDFIDRCDPYAKRKPPKFDVRGYSAYLKQNHIEGSKVTPEIMAMFVL